MQMPNASQLHENVKPDNSGFEMQIFTTALNQSMLHRLCSRKRSQQTLEDKNLKSLKITKKCFFYVKTINNKDKNVWKL